jgi:hypothetical protein
MNELEMKPKLHEHPKCAYCDANPMMLGSREIPTNHGLVLGIIWCANCGTTLAAQIVGKVAPMQLPHLKGLTGNRII